MNDLQIKLADAYEELKIELQICKTGGLFLALYEDNEVLEAIIERLRKDLPEHFHFSIQMDERKVPFSTFFGQSFEQIGKRSNIFHVLGTAALPQKSIFDLIRHLQYGREHFKSKPYSLVFWVMPELEKQLFLTAPDFHHWIYGTYDFTQINSLS